MKKQILFAAAFAILCMTATAHAADATKGHQKVDCPAAANAPEDSFVNNPANVIRPNGAPVMHEPKPVVKGQSIH